MDNRRVFALFALSGMCALIYQVVWTRWLGLILGNFTAASATVVAVYMGGMALGNALAGRFTAPLSRASALRLYSLLEASVAGWAFLSPFIFASSSPLYPALSSIPSTSPLAVLVCALLLLPPTIIMGATLPAIVQALSASSPRRLGTLYAVNTLGGAIGPLLAAFILVPGVGLRFTALIAAALNAVVAILAFRIARTAASVGRDSPTAPLDLPAPVGDAAPASNRIPFALAAASGAVALGFEIALTRLMVLTVTGGSVYGFAIILSAFLLGLALGSYLVRVWPPAGSREAYRAYAAAMAVAWLFSLTTPFWDSLPILFIHVWAGTSSFTLTTMFNFTVITALLLAFATASGFALPALAGSLRNPGSPAVGRLFAFNTAGAVLGTLATGFVLLQWIGLDRTLLALGAGAILCSAVGLALAERRWRTPALLAAPLLAALAFLLPRPDSGLLNAGLYNRPHILMDSPENRSIDTRTLVRRQGAVIYEKDGLTARVAVRSFGGQGLTFSINGKPDGSTNYGDLLTHFLPAHLAALINARPESAFLAGLGTGNTAAGLALQPTIKSVRVVEIEPAVIAVAKYFFASNNSVLSDRRVGIILDDARHYLGADPGTYDIIVSEPSNLFVSGMVNLYTREYYELVKKRLKPGGVFCQWIQNYRMSEADLRGAIGTVLAVFPNSTFWFHEMGDSFIIGTDSPVSLDLAEWRRRLAYPPVKENLARLGISPPEAVLGYLAWGPRDLERFSEGARICTDDFPYLEFTTPRIPYVRSNEMELRSIMQSFQPLQPLPLLHERAPDRQMLGDYALGSGNIARAFAEYQRALELFPRSRRIALKFAYIQWDLLGLKAGAETTLQSLLRSNPGDGEAASFLKRVEKGQRSVN